VVEVTTIREGREFEELYYPDEDEGIEKLVDAKGTFILLVKILLSKLIRRRLFPWGTEDGGTPTSNMPKPTQSSHPSATPPPAKNRQDPEL
jgi:hypothetical protein